MSEINGGGPAFPQNDLSNYGMGPAERGNGGMSLRDWFAGQALAGLDGDMSDQIFNDIGNGVRGGNLYASVAYALADRMLEARDARSAEQEPRP